MIELSLSVDNLFVFLLIFQYFAVPAELQPRILKWGILGALVMRGVMIGLGALLLARFNWIIYIFGGILILTGIRMFRGTATGSSRRRNPLVRLARRLVPVAEAYDGQRSSRGAGSGWMMTPLLLVLLVVEWWDLVFAIDSIPAIFAVTRDPFIVYSSNVFAILGLRALFFVLAGMMDRFEYLKPGVAAILVFVGGKMMVLTGCSTCRSGSPSAVIVAVAGTDCHLASLRSEERSSGYSRPASTGLLDPPRGQAVPRPPRDPGLDALRLGQFGHVRR